MKNTAPLTAALFALGAALLAVAASAKATASAPPDLVGSTLRIKDAAGRDRIFMGCDAESGSPIIFLNDTDGKTRLMLRQNAEGPTVAFYDKSGMGTDNTMSLTLRYTDEGNSPEILIRDAKGGPRMQFLADKNGKVTLRFADEKGKAKSFP